MLVKDINGKMYTVIQCYKVFFLADVDGTLLNYGISLNHLVKSTLGQHAEIIDQ